MGLGCQMVRTLTRGFGPALALSLLLAGCTEPPPSAYVKGGGGSAAAQVSIGKNTVGEACTQAADSSQSISSATRVRPLASGCT